MHNSVACSEDAPLIDTAKLDLAALNATHMGAEQVQQLIEACRDWPKGVVDADLHAPFKSAAAALLLSGADDPVTPPEYADIAQRAFADSKHVIIAGHGHGQLAAPCVDRVMASFIRAGTREGPGRELHAETAAHALLHHARGSRAVRTPDARSPRTVQIIRQGRRPCAA